MRWHLAIIAGAVALAACETNDPAEPIDVTAADLAGPYDLISIGGVAPAQIDDQFCIDSDLTMASSGAFEIQHHFTERTGVGTSQPCSTALDRFEFDVFWRGEFENTSTLVVMTVQESEFFYSDPDTTISEVTDQGTELVGEFNPQTSRLVMQFPDIWSFNPHGGSGGKISVGGDARGLGGGTLVFER